MRSERQTRPPRLLLPAAQRRRRLRGALGMLLSLAAALGHAGTPSFELHSNDRWTPTLALDSAVEMQVHGLVAEVVVRQAFVNDSGDWLEGRYLLPLPDRAAVARLRIRIGERLIEGEVQEIAHARALYQAASTDGRRAALVEQQRPNLFRTAVTNIGPGETVEVEVGYWQAVDYRDGEFSLGLPLTLTPRYRSASDTADPVPPITVAPASDGSVAAASGLEPSVSLRVELQAGVPLAEVYSPTHAIAVRAHGSAASVELADLVEPADRDFELRWRPWPSREPQRAVFVERVDGDEFAMLMLLPPARPVAALPRELVLVVDTSGSMHGDAIRQAIAALDGALLRLRPGDRFNVVRFSNHSERLFAESVAVTPQSIGEARRFVAELRAEGGTEMAPALALAFGGEVPAGFVRQVVLATDAAIDREQALLTQIERLRGDARLFPIGIGSAPNAHFIRKAGELGRGTHVLIRDIGEVAQQMEALFARLDRPMLRDLELQFPQPAEAYPERVPDLYHGEPLLLVARLPRLQGELTIRGHTADAPWQSSLRLDPLLQQPAAGIGRLWARARIEALEDALRHGADEGAIRPQIVDTALQHGLTSRYTSLIAVERTPIRPIDAALTSSVIPNAAPAETLAMAQGSTAARSRIGMALALSLLIGAVLRGRTGFA